MPSCHNGEEPRLAFQGAGVWCQWLRARWVDAVLFPVAGLVAPSEPPEPPALTAAAALDPALADVAVVAIAVASRLLPFIVASHHLPSAATTPHHKLPSRDFSPPAVLLPPAEHLPLLHADLRRQGLLPLRVCDALDPVVWLQCLCKERLLLPAHPSLLAHPPWASTSFTPLPPADPLWEMLWLLVRQEQCSEAWVEQVRGEVMNGEGCAEISESSR